MLLMIDNHDSFTYNIVRYLTELQAKVHVVRNDEITLAEAEALQPAGIVISPGPCSPSEAGISLDIVRSFAGKVPILGVCLGHQAIGQAFGASIRPAGEVMHGKVSAVHHEGLGVFRGLENPFSATRYHSLVIDKASLPDCLAMTAWTESADGQVDEIMGVRHKDFAIEGVQFHPESILSEQGHQLLQNYLHLQQ
jgi:anthranilate synthase component 2